MFSWIDLALHNTVVSSGEDFFRDSIFTTISLLDSILREASSTKRSVWIGTQI